MAVFCHTDEGAEPRNQINTNYMNKSIKIESIKTDTDGCKLIVYSVVTYFPKCKPQVSPCLFADYKNGVLRLFKGNSHISIEVGNFKHCLICIKHNISQWVW